MTFLFLKMLKYQRERWDMIMNFLGDRIRYLRENAGLKQKEMARKFSISENAWSQYENNKRTPDLETIKNIAKFFNVSIDYLMNLTDEAYDPNENTFKELISIYNLLSKEEKKKLLKEIKNRYSKR